MTFDQAQLEIYEMLSLTELIAGLDVSKWSEKIRSFKPATKSAWRGGVDNPA